jgi:Pyruvate/2-oxoacid:ferredoxin oxidoreductase delta subunit
MNKMHVTTICFSPTGTTESVIDHIVSGMGQDQPSRIDLTNMEKRAVFFANPDSFLGETDSVLVGMPVYFGYIPQFLKEKFQSVDGKGRPAAAVVVYGNRDFDYALKELCSLLESCRFRVVGAAAFVGEHSFSSNLPTAIGRPDREDLLAAKRFGERLHASVDKITPIDREEVPGKKMKHNPAALVKLPNPPKPHYIPSKCVKCGVCSVGCPMGIIDPRTLQYRDSAARRLCLGCMRCVKKCSQNARVLNLSPAIKALLKYIFLRKAMKTRREPIIVPNQPVKV